MNILDLKFDDVNNNKFEIKIIYNKISLINEYYNGLIWVEIICR